MKRKLTPVAAALCLLGILSPSVYASAENTENNAKLISTLTERTEALEEQIQELQAQLKALKAAQQPKTKTVIKYVEVPKPAPCQVASTDQTAPAKVPYRPYAQVATGAKPAIADGAANRNPYPVPQEGPPQAELPSQAKGPTVEAIPYDGQEPGQVTPVDLLIKAPFTMGGMPVVTSPYLGEHSAFDASDLVSNFPSVQLSLRILQQRQKIENVFKKYKLPLPENPYVDLGGTVQPVYVVSRSSSAPTRDGIDLGTAYLDVLGNINRWVDAFLRLTFDNNPPTAAIPTQFGPVVSNSRLFIDQGFVSIGNLNCSPFYLTMGQIYVPFGRYSTNMISSPLTSSLFRIKERAVLVGYKGQTKPVSVSAQVFAYKGDTVFTRSASRVNEGGANLAILLNTKKLDAKIAGSYVTNVADSLGMQLNGGGGFAGFAGPITSPIAVVTNPEFLVHRVPGIDVHGSLAFGPFGFLGEYVTATTHFSPLNLTFDGHAAKPRASAFEGVYNFKICNKPANIAAGYQTTTDALAFLLPKKRYIGAFNISWWKDTIQSIEYHHDINYGRFDFATGQLVPLDLTGYGLGGKSDTVIIQMAAFF